jgi:hypothetical protein
MLYIVCSVYDYKAEVFSQPFFAQGRSTAMRSFGDIASDPSHPIGKHPEDYVCYEMGTWNDNEGVIKMHPQKKIIVEGKEYKK